MKTKILILATSLFLLSCQSTTKISSSEKESTSKANIKKGSGKFAVDGGNIKQDSIIVHYYKPTNFNNTSAVVYVIPGGGRNGDDYRDAWIEKAEEYNVLVLSPEYNEKNYPEFWNYNLAGMYKDVKINEERTALESFRISNNPEEWIFNDFDRIFKLVKEILNLTTDTYDMFGHSAGGQLLHRFAIFNSSNKANRILAANSGWYSIPTDSEEFPYGLKGTIQSSGKIDFGSDLIIFLGEEDNANETRGSLRRSPEADKQGLHRLSRGNYFYNTSGEIAAELNKTFNWKLEIVPNIGHDYRKMSESAADYLYNTEKQKFLTPLETVNKRMYFYNHHNFAEFIKLYADDVKIYTYPDKLLGTGKENIISIFKPKFAAKSIQVEIVAQMSNGNHVINHEIVTEDGVETKYISIYEVNDGSIKSVRFVRDY